MALMAESLTDIKANIESIAKDEAEGRRLAAEASEREERTLVENAASKDASAGITLAPGSAAEFADIHRRAEAMKKQTEDDYKEAQKQKGIRNGDIPPEPVAPAHTDHYMYCGFGDRVTRVNTIDWKDHGVVELLWIPSKPASPEHPGGLSGSWQADPYTLLSPAGITLRPASFVGQRVTVKITRGPEPGTLR